MTRAVQLTSEQWEEHQEACSVKKEHFIARDYKPGTMAKRFHYITIATHVSGNSTYKAWWIEISEIIMQSAS